MDYLLIAATALFASGLTFFSGFGLGTILLPAFALFFSLEEAIALTAIVHFLNNLFKFALVGKHIDKRILLSFGVPAIICAFFGAKLLQHLSNSAFYSHKLFGTTTTVNTQEVIIATLIATFALFDLIPRLKNMTFSQKALPFGGAISGFFGGLSGHQGALRSAFLIKLGLAKETFVATGIAIACFIDITRISVYFTRMSESLTTNSLSYLITAVLAAFTGALIGKKLLKKTTINTMQSIVGIGMLLIAILIGLGKI